MYADPEAIPIAMSFRQLAYGIMKRSVCHSRRERHVKSERAERSSGASGDPSTPPEKMSRLALEARVRELEKENAALKLDNEALDSHVKRDSALLHALMIQGIPLDREEMLEAEKTHKSITDLLIDFGLAGQAK